MFAAEVQLDEHTRLGEAPLGLDGFLELTHGHLVPSRNEHDVGDAFSFADLGAHVAELLEGGFAGDLAVPGRGVVGGMKKFFFGCCARKIQKRTATRRTYN